MSAFFITATGTDIGKTFVAAGLIRHWRGAGREAEALKPVATGFNAAATPTSDAGVLLAAMGRPMAVDEIEKLSPWRFSAPLSPDMAARKEGRTIDFDALVAFSRNAVASTRDILLIEGIGGVMVPLDEGHTVLDWLAATEIPAVVVTGSYLGSLSHTLTALHAMASRGVGVKALVVNETAGSTVPLADTVAALRNFARNIPIVAIPRVSAEDGSRLAFAELARLLD